MRDTNDGTIFSLTLRVGRPVIGCANMISDLLAIEHQSLLILGPAGAGKTTIVRDVARILSEQPLNVIVVDKSNEICGHTVVPHKCVGMAQRMMVPSLNRMGKVLVEAIQNHTPDVIICSGKKTMCLRTRKKTKNCNDFPTKIIKL